MSTRRFGRNAEVLASTLWPKSGQESLTGIWP